MFAKLYEALMADVDYDQLFHFFKKHMSSHHVSILDAGCGSGNFLMTLLKHDMNAFGIDYDESMLAIAQQKLSEHGYYAPLYVHDLNEPLPIKVDVITSFFDVVNYFKQTQSLFKNMYDALNDGGIYMFDCYQEDVLTTYQNYEEIENEPVPYTWHIHVDHHELHHIIQYDHQQTKVLQYVHPIKELEAQLQAVGFHVTYEKGPDIRKWYVIAKK